MAAAGHFGWSSLDDYPGTQSIADYWNVWAYFPGKNTEAQFLAHTLRVEQFLAAATDGQKLQYERFVVLKEGLRKLVCGGGAVYNSLGFFLFPAFFSAFQGLEWRLATAATILSAFVVFTLVGLYRMHWQHVKRQWGFADAIASRPDLHRNLSRPKSLHDDSRVIGGQPGLNRTSPLTRCRAVRARHRITAPTLREFSP